MKHVYFLLIWAPGFQPRLPPASWTSSVGIKDLTPEAVESCSSPPGLTNGNALFLTAQGKTLQAHFNALFLHAQCSAHRQTLSPLPSYTSIMPSFSSPSPLLFLQPLPGFSEPPPVFPPKNILTLRPELLQNRRIVPLPPE